MPDVSTAGDYLKGLARAFGPDLVGMPVDAAQEALNLLIAGGGFVGHKLGLLKQPPDLLHGSPGTSDWWADKVNIPDNGSAAYTAGRLTPLGVALTKAASPAAAEALKKGMANLQAPVAASPGAGQRGAIRVGGDPDLFAHTSITPQKLERALGDRKTLELYSPSIAITKGMQPVKNFGDLVLVPKVGAFDPATSTATLFNRDAWTARYKQYKGSQEVDNHQGIDPYFTMPLAKLYTQDEFLQALQQGTLNEKVAFPYDGATSSYAGNLYPYNWHKAKYTGVVDDLEALADYKPGMMDEEGLNLLKSYYNKGVVALDSKPTIYPSLARARLEDRFHGVRPEDTRLNEGDAFGSVLGGPGGLKQTSIELSPAFRSFAQYEKSPLGAALLNSSQHPRDYQAEVLDRAFKGDTWIGYDAMADLVKRAANTPEKFMKNIGYSPELREAWRNNGFGPQYIQDMQDPQTVSDLWKAASKARREIAKTPSRYAELKVHGPAPVNAENWAFGFVRPGSHEDFPDAVLDALTRVDVPIMTKEFINDMASRGQLENVVRDMQRIAGPARKSPL